MAYKQTLWLMLWGQSPSNLAYQVEIRQQHGPQRPQARAQKLTSMKARAAQTYLVMCFSRLPTTQRERKGHFPGHICVTRSHFHHKVILKRLGQQEKAWRFQFKLTASQLKGRVIYARGERHAKAPEARPPEPEYFVSLDATRRITAPCMSQSNFLKHGCCDQSFSF